MVEPREKLLVERLDLHLGEMLPFNAWRIDHRLSKSPRGIPARRSVTDYLRTNVYVTTSGHFRTAALELTIAEMGADRVLFSIDYPFEDMADATTWFAGTNLSDAHRALIAAENARRVLRLT